MAGLALGRALQAPRGSPDAAGLGLVLWLAIAMIEFPSQNTASAILALLLLTLVAPGAATPARPRALPLAAGLESLLLAVPAAVEVTAQNRFTAADLLHKAGRLDAAADAMGPALATSDWAPKLRLRLYPQSIVAGLDYWNRTGIPELERHHAVSASAAPRHPVLLDLRLKFLLALTQPSAAEVKAALADLKINYGL